MTPHFSLNEFTKSDTAIRLGINNIPGTIARQNLETLCKEVLEPIRQYFNKPVRVTSGYRSRALNDAVGSKPSSDHVQGCAADIEITGIPNIDVATWIRDKLDYHQVILEFFRYDDPNAGWVHVSYRKNGNRKQVLTIGIDGTQKGLP